jgi:hypothetical protein
MLSYRNEVINGILRLMPTTNGAPQLGDLWYDGTNFKACDGDPATEKSLDFTAPTFDSPIKMIYKTAVETVTNSTVYQNDDHLVLPLGVGEWVVWLAASATLSTNGGFKHRFTFSGTHTVTSSYTSWANASASNVSTSLANAFTGVEYNHTGTAHDLYAESHAYINVTATGDLRVQFAQQTATVNLCELKPGSHLVAVKVA